MWTRLLSLTALALVVTAVTAQETLPPGAKLTRLEVYPASVALKNPFDYNQLLVTGVLAGGERVDVTRLVKVEVEHWNPRIAKAIADVVAGDFVEYQTQMRAVT